MTQQGLGIARSAGDDAIRTRLRKAGAVSYAHTIGGTRYRFPDLKTLLARASPKRSGDMLAGLAAADMTERAAAQCALAELPLARFAQELLIPYEADEVTRLILDGRDEAALAPAAHLTIGG